MGGGRGCVGMRLLVVIVILSGEPLAEVCLAGLLSLSSAKGAYGLLVHVTC